MTRWIFIIAFGLCPTLSWASGWTDYSLTIDPGYQIVRCNNLDVVLTTSTGEGVLAPRDYPGLGPICGYATTPKYIFTRHYGRKLRNLFVGDTYEDVDTSKQFLCITQKSDNHVVGPLSQSSFNARPEVQAAGAIIWKVPNNPHPSTALTGTIYFCLISLLIFGLPIGTIAALVITILILLKKRRRHSI